MAFDKVKYDLEYKKKNLKQFKVDLRIEEMEELEELLKKFNLTKATFLRSAISDLKNKSTSKK